MGGQVSRGFSQGYSCAASAGTRSGRNITVFDAAKASNTVMFQTGLFFFIFEDGEIRTRLLRT